MSKTHFYGRVAAEKIFSDYLRRTFTDPQDGLICCRIRGAWALGTPGEALRVSVYDQIHSHLLWPTSGGLDLPHSTPWLWTLLSKFHSWLWNSTAICGEMAPRTFTAAQRTRRVLAIV